MFGEVFAQPALAAFLALAGQQLVRHFVQRDLPQDLLRHDTPGEHHRPRKHHFRQGLVVVLLKVGIHGAEGVVPRLVATGDLIHVYIFIVVFLPAGQDPVPPEYIAHAALTAAEHAGVAAQGHAHVVVKGIGAAHQAPFVYQAFQFETGVVHLFQLGGRTQDLTGWVERLDSALLLPDGHLPQVPLVGVAGGMQLQIRHQGVQQYRDAVIGKDHPLQLVMPRHPGKADGEILQIVIVVKLVVHGVDRADAPDLAFGQAQKIIAVADVLGPPLVGVRRVRIGAVLAIEGEADMGEHLLFIEGKLAIHVVYVLDALFHFHHKPLRHRAVVGNRILAVFWVHNFHLCGFNCCYHNY